MDKEEMKHIFEPFYTTKDKSKGHGLGLPVCYGIIKSHKGFINLYSEKGKGACFKIYLPATGEKIEALENIKEKVYEKGTGTIMIVDDDIQVIELAKRVLERNGYTVILAQTGGEAIEVYNNKKDAINLILLDYIMPGLSGKETFEELKKINPEVKVIISTGYSMSIHSDDLLKLGVKGLLQKPFAVTELLKEINDVLNAHVDPAVNLK
jgi:CheY-like chemotaxis protein